MPAQRASRPILCLVVDRNATRHPLVPAVENAFAAGVDWLQIRDRELEAAALLDLARDLALAAARGAARRGRHAHVIVNRRIDVARALGLQPDPEAPERRAGSSHANVASAADRGVGSPTSGMEVPDPGAIGVHLGFDAVSVEDARALLGHDARIGVSAHTPAEVGDAARAGASYAHLAPIFAPLSKRAERPPLGLPALEQACRFAIPVLAQGGIDVARCADVLGAGAAGIAVTGSILRAPDPEAAARALREALDAAPA